jgi:hypothetical protein
LSGAGVVESVSLFARRSLFKAVHILSPDTLNHGMGSFKQKDGGHLGLFMGTMGYYCGEPSNNEQRSATKAICPLVSSPYVVVVSQETNSEIAWIWQMVLLHNPVKSPRYPFQSEV